MTGRRVLALGAAGALLAGTTSVGGTAAAILIGVAAGAAVRLALGTSAGLPTVADVAAALDDLGVAAQQLAPAERQVAGVFVVHGREPDGTPLTIKVYGRDAYDNQMLEKLWRRLWYRDGGLGRERPQPCQGRRARGAADAARAQRRGADRRGRDGGSDGARRLAGRAARRSAGRSTRSRPAEIDDALLGRSWDAVREARRRRTSPMATSAPPRCAATRESVSLVDLGGGTVAPDLHDRLTDRAQLLATTAAVAGPTAPIAAARRGASAATS